MKIYDIAKCVSGNVLGIGLEEEIVEILEQNDRIIDCKLLNVKVKAAKTKGKKEKTKKIRIKKLRKIFKKKKVDFIICNIDDVKKYLKTFIRDSVYINKEILYMYNIKDEETKIDLIKKYKRYNTEIEEIKENNSIILKIDNKKSYTNLFKDIKYSVIDTAVTIFNLISDILLS